MSNPNPKTHLEKNAWEESKDAKEDVWEEHVLLAPRLFAKIELEKNSAQRERPTDVVQSTKFSEMEDPEDMQESSEESKKESWTNTPKESQEKNVQEIKHASKPPANKSKRLKRNSEENQSVHVVASKPSAENVQQDAWKKHAASVQKLNAKPKNAESDTNQTVEEITSSKKDKWVECKENWKQSKSFQSELSENSREKWKDVSRETRRSSENSKENSSKKAVQNFNWESRDAKEDAKNFTEISR